jgi:2-polyprenyl-3-methyl-5-hydroxy-6-metoxy-1,4-benzoquinol methylase
MMARGAPLRGGMPRYKYVGNRILSTYQNAMTGAQLSEWHSGYRAYSVEALKNIPFGANSDGFDFDTEIIVQLLESGARIVELPIPTYYGDEICHVNGMKYAWDVSRLTTRYRLHKMGFGTGELAFNSNVDSYELKNDMSSSHGKLLSWLAQRPAGRVLDLGCSDGSLAQRIRAVGHEVTGVDLTKHDAVSERVDHFIEANLEQGIPSEAGSDFDVVVCADVLEHVREPEALLQQAKHLLGPGGSIIASVPNFGHWYPRARTALGMFDYDRRGILDHTHVRFFTRRSFERLVAAAGLVVVKRDVTGLPVDVADRGAGEGEEVADKLGPIAKVDRLATRLRPQLFGYQFLYELKPAA